MLVTFENELVKTLKSISKNAGAYLGEFEDKQEMELLIKGADELILVEFVSDDYKNEINRFVNFNIHIFSSTQSKSPKARLENRHKVLRLCEEVDELLLNSNLSNEFRITLNGLSVNYNSISEYGYAYILTRKIQTELLKKDEFLECE